jgi:PBSX family phage terminase large subunit
MMMFSQKQLEVLAFPYTKYKALVCDGAIRSGKTSVMMWAFIDWAMKNFNGKRFGICGKTVDSAIKNVVEPFLQMTLTKERYSIRFRRQDKVVEIKRGDRENVFEIFGGKDSGSYMLIQGRTLAGVFLDEVALQPQSFVEQALARCSVSGSRYWFNCNPGPPSHWFYQEWILEAKRRNALHLHFVIDDNPALDDEIKRGYHAMYSGVFYRRYILGEWCIADGLVYPMFDKAKYIATEQHSGGVYYISIDYGTLNPTAMGLWQLRNGKAVMLKEYYYDGRKQKRQKTDEEYADDLEAFAEGYQIERVIVDPSAASFKETLRRRGKFAVMDANNAVLDGIRLTGSLLLAGRILFDASCENTFDEFGSYCWDEKKETDAVVKESDHAMDMIRYFVYTIMRREVR